VAEDERSRTGAFIVASVTAGMLVVTTNAHTVGEAVSAQALAALARNAAFPRPFVKPAARAPPTCSPSDAPAPPILLITWVPWRQPD